MKYTEVKYPSWVNAEHTEINCYVNFDDLEETFVPFTASLSDPYNPASKEIFNDCVSGKYGEIAEYVVPTPSVPTAAANKLKATSLLQETDWTTVADVADPALSNPYLMNQSAFFAYRSALRQIAVNPVEGVIAFPVKPVEQWSQ